METKEITNIVLVPEGFEGAEALDTVLETMKDHPGFLYMNRSDGVFSPQGPTGYAEIIEVHWKGMEMLMDWSEGMRNNVPVEKQQQLAGVQILFYEYR